MSASFWVSLSTIVFLIIVGFKSSKLIGLYFLKQQDDIKKRINDANDVYQKAQNLYQEYANKIEALDSEAMLILDNANHEAKKIVDNAQSVVDKMIEKKNQELSKRISEYEMQTKNYILSKYADIIVDDLYEKASKNNFETQKID
jgi:F0F1-type ATP synthase membrane subunit b/b'